MRFLYPQELETFCAQAQKNALAVGHACTLAHVLVAIFPQLARLFDAIAATVPKPPAVVIKYRGLELDREAVSAPPLQQAYPDGVDGKSRPALVDAAAAIQLSLSDDWQTIGVLDEHPAAVLGR